MIALFVSTPNEALVSSLAWLVIVISVVVVVAHTPPDIYLWATLGPNARTFFTGLHIAQVAASWVEDSVHSVPYIVRAVTSAVVRSVLAVVHATMTPSAVLVWLSASALSVAGAGAYWKAAVALRTRKNRKSRLAASENSKPFSPSHFFAHATAIACLTAVIGIAAAAAAPRYARALSRGIGVPASYVACLTGGALIGGAYVALGEQNPPPSSVDAQVLTHLGAVSLASVLFAVVAMAVGNLCAR